jgi:hypothetical protein
MAANSLGAAAQATGGPSAAYGVALTTARRIGYRAQEARALLGLRAAAAALGRDAEADRHLGAAARCRRGSA